MFYPPLVSPMRSHLSLFLFYILPRWTFLCFILRAVIILFWPPRFFILTDGWWWMVDGGRVTGGRKNMLIWNIPKNIQYIFLNNSHPHIRLLRHLLKNKKKKIEKNKSKQKHIFLLMKFFLFSQFVENNCLQFSSKCLASP